jgi:geranylgeranyl diphosphate synthase type I
MNIPSPVNPASEFSVNSPSCLADQFASAYAASVENLRCRLTAFNGMQPADSILAAFCQVPGKHVRPYLFLSACQLLTDTRNPGEELLAVACAQEHFHNFLLIHDDVIDASTSRRNHPTLHEALRAQAAIGQPEHLAIILGNILYSYAMEGFLHPKIESLRAGEALRYFLAIVHDTGIGEALELLNIDRTLEAVDEATILATYDLKTSRYTFEAPLALAMILSNSHTPERLAAIRSFTRPIGIAFQIENDLHEIELDPKVSLERAFDLMHGIKTLYLKRAFEMAHADERKRLTNFLQNPDADYESCKAIFQWLQKSPVRHQISQTVDDLFKESRELLDNTHCFTTKEKNGFEQLLNYIHAHRKHSENKTAITAN